MEYAIRLDKHGAYLDAETLLLKVIEEAGNLGYKGITDPIVVMTLRQNVTLLCHTRSSAFFKSASNSARLETFMGYKFAILN